MANDQNMHDIIQIVQAVCELIVTSGAAAAAARYFQAKGVDIKAVRNNQIVQAAFNAGKAALLKLELNGGNLKDPAVVQSAISAAQTTMLTTHVDMAKSINASVENLKTTSADQTLAASEAIFASRVAAKALPSTTSANPVLGPVGPQVIVGAPQIPVPPAATPAPVGTAATA